MTEVPKKVCILGGGFAGLYTALRLSELPWLDSQQPEITLVDKNENFLFSPLLYELITGEMQAWEIAPGFSEILGNTPISHKQAEVKNVDLSENQVHLKEDSKLNYDYLVIATGGDTPTDFVPGVNTHAFTFRSLNDAYLLGNKLKELENKPSEYIRTVIVGGGYSGVELACKLADRLGKRGRIRIVERSDMILRSSPEFNREAATKALEAKKVWLDLETEVTEINSDNLSLNYKGKIDNIPVDLVIWTVGIKPSPWLEGLSIEKSSRGFINTNSYLQVLNSQEIYALGDIADCLDAENKQVPKTAQVAIQQADYCAWNIWASCTGRPLLPFRYQNLGEIMTLGVDNATLTGLGLKIDGSLAHTVRRLVYLYRLPTRKHKLNVGLNWLTQPLVELFVNS